LPLEPPPPRRIVSLVPSATETLAVLGAADRVAGRTRWCVRPQPWVRSVPEVGGTKDPDLAAIAALRPDLIVVNEEENRREHFDALQRIAPLHAAFPRDVDGAVRDLLELAGRLGAKPAGAALAGRIGRQRSALRAGARPFRFAYAVWRAPWRLAGPDTFVSALLAEAGGVNVAPAGPGRYPPVTPRELQVLLPDVVLLPSEPFEFGVAHAAELGPLAGCARLVDGALLCWHGARLEGGLAYLRGLRLVAGRAPEPRVAN
jgi:ABC-type Fe3+-hydroxamate transport system substrate-binding protein